MADQRANRRPSCVYIGLAGETGRGRIVHSGLYRMADGDDEWEPITRGLPEAPAVRAQPRSCLCRHPIRPLPQR